MQPQAFDEDVSRLNRKDRYCETRNGFVEYSERGVAIALGAYREDALLSVSRGE